MKYFISRSNFLRISARVSLDASSLSQQVYQKKIYFFNRLEEQRILSVQQFLKHSEDGLVQFKGTGYVEDTFSYVHEHSHHSKYHLDENCKGLISAFKDIEIPVEIKYREGSSSIDIERVNSFRLWFKQPEIFNLYNTDQVKFIEKLQLKFMLKNPPKPVELRGQGVHRISNLSETQLVSLIDKLISDASQFYNKSEKTFKILRTHGFSRKTFLVTSSKYVTKEISENNTGYSDDEVRQVLLDFYDTVKKPLINYLIDYWIVKLNPKLDFNSNILEQMQFLPCNMCFNNIVQPLQNLDIDDSILDLPF